jgi:hypothetical protein
MCAAAERQWETIQNNFIFRSQSIDVIYFLLGNLTKIPQNSSYETESCGLLWCERIITVLFQGLADSFPQVRFERRREFCGRGNLALTAVNAEQPTTSTYAFDRDIFTPTVRLRIESLLPAI